MQEIHVEPQVPNREKLPDHWMRLCIVMIYAFGSAALFLHFVVVGTRTSPRAANVYGLTIILDSVLLVSAILLVGRTSRNFRLRFTMIEVFISITIIAVTCAVLREVYLWVAADPVKQANVEEPKRVAGRWLFPSACGGPNGGSGSGELADNHVGGELGAAKEEMDADQEFAFATQCKSGTIAVNRYRLGPIRSI